MWWAIIGSLWLLGIMALWFRGRNRYLILAVDCRGRPRERVIKLPLQRIAHVKLRAEIKIFNRLHLVMPTLGGVPVVYRQHLAALLKDPRHQPSTDPYDRLLYGYACAILLTKVTDEVKRRQLANNLRFLLAPRKKIVVRRKVVWSPQVYQLRSVPLYKVFGDTCFDPYQPRLTAGVPLTVVACPSYLRYLHPQLEIKQFANFYEIQAHGTQTLTLTVAKDKREYACSIARGVVTVKHLPSGGYQTFTVRGEQVRLATSVCAHTDSLQIYLTCQGTASISVNRGTRELLTVSEIQANTRVEQILATAFYAQMVRGEKLRARYLATLKLIPTLSWLSRVVEVGTPQDFLAVWDCLADYRRAAKICHGFNLIFLYAGANPLVGDLVSSLTSAEQIKACEADQLLVYMVDRTTADPDVLYYLAKMARPQKYAPPALPLENVKVGKAYPVVTTLMLCNPTAQAVTKQLVWPLKFSGPQVVTANGTLLTTVSLAQGRVTTYQLPVAMHWTGEWVTSYVNLPIKIKLVGFETRQLQITRYQPDFKQRLRKKDLLAALEEIEIKTAVPKLNELFRKPVDVEENPALLKMVKAAGENQDQKLLLATLEDKFTLPNDVWQYLLFQIVGIRVVGGKIHLSPCINIMGEFELSLVCRGTKMTFSTRKGLPKTAAGVTIGHG